MRAILERPFVLDLFFKIIEAMRFTLFIVMFLVILVSCQKNSENDPLNVIYISIEDAMPTLGCYGDTIVYTPNIDKFANESVLFMDAHCNVALCTPSRTSILTGIRPTTSGIVKINDPWMEMLPNTTSIPRHFRDHGYHTVLAGKIYDTRCGGMDSAFSKIIKETSLYNNEKAFEAIEAAKNQDDPFMLMIGYFKTHDIWEPSEKSKALYNPDWFSAKNRSNHFKGDSISDEQVRKYVRDYYADITDVDSLIGEVLEKVKANGWYENSIILVGAFDHGYGLGLHDHWGKGNNWDNETRVPMLIHVPGNKNNGKVTRGITELVDIYPTLVDLCGIPQPQQQLEGISLKSLLENPDREWKKAAFTVRAYHPNDRGVKTKDYTLIDRQEEPIQLYDRKTDPDNLNNIAKDNPDIVKEMKNILEEGWEEALPE
jgi:arylsulfatase A-like enzyme